MGRREILLKIFAKIFGNTNFVSIFVLPKRSIMQLDLFGYPGDVSYEYVILLGLPEAVKKRVVTKKRDFFSKYGTLSAIRSAPHMKLVSFTMKSSLEDRIIESLEKVSLGEAPFKVSLKNYGAYEKHSISIKVQDREPILSLCSQLSSLLSITSQAPLPPAAFTNEPAIEIASGLTPGVYLRAAKEYAKKMFTDLFVANSLLLLKRRNEHQKYQVVRGFEFMGLPFLTCRSDRFSSIPSLSRLSS
jgi:hypothetical protein